MHIKPGRISVLLALALCAAMPARAQNARDEILVYEPVGSRIPADYAPQGIHFRGFVLYPELKVSPLYDDNIFLSEDNAQGDFVTNIAPRLRIEKKYGPHSFDFDAQGFITRHREFTDENLKLYTAETGGNIHIAEGWSALYRLFSKRDVISRQEPGDTQFSEKPITNDRNEVSVGLAKQFNRLTLTLLGKAGRRTYADGTSSVTGLPLVNDDNNHTTRRAELLATYDLLGANTEVPEHTLFASLSHQTQTFDDGVATATGMSPDNTENGFMAGFTTKYKGLIFGKLGLGYFRRDFEAGKDVGKLDTDISLAFNLTPKLTLSLGASREVDQDNAFLTGVVNTQGMLGLDYELLHNWFVGASYTYKDKEFLGDLEGRNDKIGESVIYTRYLHSPRFESRFEVEHDARESNAAGADYDRNVFMYTLTTRF